MSNPAIARFTATVSSSHPAIFSSTGARALQVSDARTGASNQEVSVNKKAVCLFSGGIDSPVAAWLLAKRGYELVLAYLDNYPFTDETTQTRAVKVATVLSELLPQRRARVHIVPHGPNLAEILRTCPRRLTCILCRRMMYRLAERIAVKEGASYIATGEILGEHASQTSKSLDTINASVSIGVLRPLIAMDKLEVERLARGIGTYAASTSPGVCCSGPPKHPATHPDRDAVEVAERALSIEEMLTRGFADSRTLLVTAG